MKKGRTRTEEDECPICNLPLPLNWEQSVVKVCWLHDESLQRLHSGI